MKIKIRNRSLILYLLVQLLIHFNNCEYYTKMKFDCKVGIIFVPLLLRCHQSGVPKNTVILALAATWMVLESFHTDQRFHSFFLLLF